MNIDEFIEHTKEKAEEYKYRASFFESDNPMNKACIKVAKDHEQLAEWFEKSKEYQQLEEQDRLIKLPCKVGDTVYQIFENFIEPCTVEVIFLGDYTDKDGNHCNMAEIHYDREDCPCVLGDIYFTDFGKTVFLTKSAAEEKLKELRGGE